MFLDRVLDFFGATDHAWRGAAELDKVFAYLRAIKHCVERRHFVHADRRHF